MYISFSFSNSSFVIILLFSSSILFFFENILLFFIFLIFWAKLSVNRVSWRFFFKEEIVAMKQVLGWTTNDSFNKNVNLVSLIGIKFSPKFWITLPRPKNDLFIFPASFIWSPVFSFDVCLSLLARSTKFNIVVLLIILSFSNFVLHMEIEKIEWLLDWVFII